MSKKSVIVLVYHCHKLLDLINKQGIENTSFTDRVLHRCHKEAEMNLENSPSGYVCQFTVSPTLHYAQTKISKKWLIVWKIMT
jgi:hypothetical protein